MSNLTSHKLPSEQPLIDVFKTTWLIYLSVKRRWLKIDGWRDEDHHSLNKTATQLFSSGFFFFSFVVVVVRLLFFSLSFSRFFLSLSNCGRPWWCLVSIYVFVACNGYALYLSNLIGICDVIDVCDLIDFWMSIFIRERKRLTFSHFLSFSLSRSLCRREKNSVGETERETEAVALAEREKTNEHL